MNTIIIIGFAMLLCGTLPMFGVWLGSRIAWRRERERREVEK